jgi:tungstate transport system substrate-binding protein
MRLRTQISCIALTLWFLTFASAHAAEPRLRMSTTTSTENTGLLQAINPVFEKKYGVKVDVIAVGTGKALKLAENGDVDIVLVHDPELEGQFMAAGFGIDRRAVMHNDFVIVGPPSDLANVRQTEMASAAFRNIAQRRATFISRGDESGTHQKEKAIWKEAGIQPGGDWYLAIGQGMGAVLQVADDKQAYALTDRGTYIAYQQMLDLAILLEGDPLLLNPYHVIAVNPARHPHARYDLAKQYVEFITGPVGQRLIRDFRINGQQLFYPDAAP